MNSVVSTLSAAISRREFIRVVGASGLALMIDLPELQAQQASNAEALRRPSAFIQIAPDGQITITTPSMEMGQGAHTAMPMIVMEELGGDWSRMVVKDAPVASVYKNPVFGRQVTVGSRSVIGWYNDLRKVGAAAREMLVQAAANQWSVPASQCSVSNSVITHQASGRRISFGEVAEQAAKLPVPQSPTLKNSTQFQTIGTFKPRRDVPFKVDGSAKYGIDVQLPDMVYATVKACPTHGGKLKSFDDSAAKQVSGYIATVPIDDGVIVVANRFWQAKKAAELVKAEYDLGKLATLDSRKVSEQLRAGFSKTGAMTRNDGDVLAAFTKAASVLEAEYEAPYLAHACMEPMNCVARLTDEGCEVWCGTQGPQAVQEAAAAVLGVPAERIKVNVMFLGGGFGRRGEADYATHAVTAAKALRRPVKLIWTREEDIQHDYYRPAAMVRFRAAFDANQKLTAVESNMVIASVPAAGGVEATSAGIADATYNFPSFRVTNVNANLGIRFGYWRSVQHSHHPYMIEGFMDEVAHKLGQDPYQFRRSLLQHDKGKRQLGVLDMLAEKAGWGKAPKGRAQGIAAFFAYGSFIGTVCEVSVKDKQITLHRVVVVTDCGIAIYPDNIHAQMQGGTAFGLTAALRGEITLDKGAIQQSNFHDYPMLMMSEMPEVESYIVPSSEFPGGVGEPSTAAITPAFLNAIYAATGERIRSLPLTKQGYSFAASRV